MSISNMNRRTFLGTSVAAGFAWKLGAQAKKARVGCQANGFVMRNGTFETLLPVLTQIASLGYAGFECNNRLLQSEFANPAEARKRISASGLEFIGMHMSTTEAEKNLEAVAAGAAALGCRNIVMSSSGLSPTGTFTSDALTAKAAQLEQYGTVCKAHGVTLAYHNHQPEFANHNAEIQGLADHTKPELVSFLMDAGHGYQGSGDPAEFMRKNSRRLVGCHLKTFKDKIDQKPLGAGDFGFEDLAAAVRETGWSGWLIDEEGGGKTTDSDAVGPDRAYIRKTFGV